MGEKQALIVQGFEVLAKVLSMALGKSKKGSDPNTNLLEPKNSQELQAKFKKMFG